MIPIEHFPLLNATLNSIATVLIVAGWMAIRSEAKRTHGLLMGSAILVSALFLACYLYYHSQVVSVKFTHEGWIRPVYFIILISHIILAFTVPPLVILTVIPALRARYDRHKRLARWTLPIWLYVSVTGVVIYFMLYVWFPPENLDEILQRSRS